LPSGESSDDVPSPIFLAVRAVDSRNPDRICALEGEFVNTRQNSGDAAKQRAQEREEKLS
jgi:hypothetical protein